MLDAVISGVFTGFGSAIGTYIAFKYAIDHLEKIPTAKDKIKQYAEKMKP